MRNIIVQEFITLDGVMQAPGGPEEDASNSFKYGGWTAPYFREADNTAAEFMQRWMESTDILLGRTTYEIFAEYWPSHADMWPGINDVTKYVVSDTPIDLTWHNSELITGDDVVAQLKKLKDSEGSDIKVHGSSKVAQTLLENGLVDELYLMTFPVILGTGKRLFAEGSVPGAFALVDSVVTPNGVICAYYKRTGEVQTGTVGA